MDADTLLRRALDALYCWEVNHGCCGTDDEVLEGIVSYLTMRGYDASLENYTAREEQKLQEYIASLRAPTTTLSLDPEPEPEPTGPVTLPGVQMTRRRLFPDA